MYSFNFSNTQEWPRIFVDSSLAVSPHIRLSSSKIPVTHQTPRVRAKVWCSGNNYKQFLAVYWYRNHFAFLTFWSIYLTDVKSSSFEIASRNQVHAWKDLSTFMSSRQSMFDCFCKQINRGTTIILTCMLYALQSTNSCVCKNCRLHSKKTA